MKNNFNEYATKGTTNYNILELHYKGYPPTSIDCILGLLMGEAHRVIVDYWAWDKKKHSNKRVRRQSKTMVVGE